MRNSKELNKQIADGLILLAGDYFKDSVFNKVQHPAYEAEALLRYELSKTVFDNDNINYVSAENKSIAKALRAMAYEFDDGIEDIDNMSIAYSEAKQAALFYMNIDKVDKTNEYSRIRKYYCKKCHRTHFVDSPLGRSHKKISEVK